MDAVSERELTLLAGLLGQPGPDSLEAVDEMAAGLPWLQAACPQLRTTPLEEWQAEHTRLFVNGIPKTICPPFESYWRHGSLGGSCVQAIAGLYRRAGVEADPDIAPDFLGSLLDLAVHLRLQHGRLADVEQELWQEHLLVWVPQFAARLRDSSSLILYGSLGARFLDLSGEGRVNNRSGTW
ncbi:MAG: molecular chaperone TorD family protein [Magnetococcales bacterium]|nr:molecular chaperone TorD family protein [Magnetococcales bacterium]